MCKILTPKILGLIALPLLLAGCLSPLERCIAQANRPAVATASAITETQGNIARGYAIHTQTVPYPIMYFCTPPGERAHYCTRQGYRTVETPVAINIDQERRKLASLRKILTRQKTEAQRATAQCRATITP
ncbi:MAG: hypothetical protein NWQ69_06315 [Paracoccaceae bacterium]|nr:hypothetical protein [Paracoccaceae bacterium]